jgi:hypothetical protein
MAAINDLDDVFAQTGAYSFASNRECIDTTEIFIFKVEDPTVNGSLNLRAVCYNETKFRLEVSCATWGMQPAKRNAISFCDGDPTKPGAIKLEITFLLPGFLFHSYT